VLRRLLLPLPILLLGACGDAVSTTSSPPAAIEDGQASGYLLDVDARGTITLDRATMLSGDAAVRAALADGNLPDDGQLPNDFYIDNDAADSVVLQVAPAAVVQLYDCTGGCELRSVPVGDLLTGDAVPFNGDGAFVDLEVEDGAVTALREVYFP
jgi:hypothetical protein